MACPVCANAKLGYGIPCPTCGTVFDQPPAAPPRTYWDGRRPGTVLIATFLLAAAAAYAVEVRTGRSNNDPLVLALFLLAWLGPLLLAALGVAGRTRK